MNPPPAATGGESELASAIRHRLQQMGRDKAWLVKATGLTRQGLEPLLRGEHRKYQDRLKLPVCRALGWPPDAIDLLMDGLPLPPEGNGTMSGRWDDLARKLDELANRLDEVERSIQESGPLLAELSLMAETFENHDDARSRAVDEQTAKIDAHGQALDRLLARLDSLEQRQG